MQFMIRNAGAVILMMVLHVSSSAAEPLFAVALTHTPVLNTPDFHSIFGGKDGKTLRKDECGQLRSLEFVALPETVFRIEAELKSGNRTVYRVKTRDYPYPSNRGYFVDAGFVKLQGSNPPERTKTLPAKENIIAALKKMTGSRYVWGGNSAAGLAELLSWYPPADTSKLGNSDKSLWILAGVDCSGLLYEATGGYTPRNTSSLPNFGKNVTITGKSLHEITVALKPLDLLVWPGHVIIVIDDGNIIESRLVCNEPDKGVRIRPLVDALRDIMKKRKPADVLKNGAGEFVVRRWYGITE
jgi:cell wall-associated NlpC family hydrolase